MSANSSVVLVDNPAPHIARLLINRPDKRNAIDYDVRQGLTDALREIFANPDYRAIVFAGAEGMFSAGGDIPSMVGLSEQQARDRMRHIHILCRLIANTGLPVVSAIEGIGAGAAVGLALLGDYIVMGESAKVLFPFLKLGLTPDWGSLQSLPRRVGLPRAMQILSSGKFIESAEAYRIGLVDEVAADGTVMNAAIAKASEFAMLPADAFARMKARLVNASASFEEELKREENDQAACLLSDEFREGYAAFKEKRSVDFLKLPRKPD